MLDQIIEAINHYADENKGFVPNEKALQQIRANAKAYDRLVNDRHYTMKTEITDENACVIQFCNEQGAVVSTYTFFNALIAPK